MITDFHGKVALVTGGTTGVGLATAVAFVRHGAECILIYNQEDAHVPEELGARFGASVARLPRLMPTKVNDDARVEAILGQLKQHHRHVDVLISTLTAVPVVDTLEEYGDRALFRAVGDHAWPIFAYTRRIQQIFGRYPRYVIGLSSLAPDYFSPGYDFVGASEAVLETLCRYFSYRLINEDLHINVLRSHVLQAAPSVDPVDTRSAACARHSPREDQVGTEVEVANVAMALCSGLLDGVRGQVITVDRGWSFSDKPMRLYDECERMGHYGSL